MGNNSKQPIVVGIVGHLSPEFLTDFKQHIEKFSHFRLIIFKESDDKLWIVSRSDKPYD